MSRYIQADGERKRYTIDYSEWLDDGETVSSIGFAISPTTSPPMVVDGSQTLPTHDGVLFYVSGGLVKTKYKIVATMVTSGGQTKEDAITISILNP